MHITQWGEYGIHCVTSIARCELEGRSPVGAAEIARALGLSIDYTQQVLQRLRKGGVIESVRGPQGGYRLVRPASDLTMFEVLTAAEGGTFDVICETKPIDPTRCSPEHECGLRGFWLDLRTHVNQFLEGQTVQDLLSRQTTAEIVQIRERAL